MSTAIVLYASHKAVTRDSQPIKVGQSVIWIRVEEKRLAKGDLEMALDLACPLKHEMVLNSLCKTVEKDNGTRSRSVQKTKASIRDKNERTRK